MRNHKRLPVSLLHILSLIQGGEGNIGNKGGRSKYWGNEDGLTQVAIFLLTAC